MRKITNFFISSTISDIKLCKFRGGGGYGPPPPLDPRMQLEKFYTPRTSKLIYVNKKQIRLNSFFLVKFSLIFHTEIIEFSTLFSNIFYEENVVSIKDYGKIQGHQGSVLLKSIERTVFLFVGHDFTRNICANCKIDFDEHWYKNLRSFMKKNWRRENVFKYYHSNNNFFFFK